MDSDLEEIRKLKLEKKVFRLRHRDALPWSEVASKVSKEFNKNISSKYVQEVYDRHISRSRVILDTKSEANKAALEANKDWVDEMKELLEKIKTKTLRHLEIADEILIEQYDSGDTKAYFHNLPVAISLFRSLLDQAGFLGKRLEKIEITQKNFILNETQVLQIINKKMSQREREQGYKVHTGTGEIIVIKNTSKKVL